MDDRTYRALTGSALFVGVGSLCWFLAALLDSDRPAQAQALGNVIGGVIGALGAGLAVYFTLAHDQRKQAGADAKLKKHVEFATLQHIQSVEFAKMMLDGEINNGKTISPQQLLTLRLREIAVDSQQLSRFGEAFPSAFMLLRTYLDSRDAWNGNMAALVRRGVDPAGVRKLALELNGLALDLSMVFRYGFDYPDDHPMVKELIKLIDLPR